MVEVEDNLPVPSRPVDMGITNDNAWSDDDPEEVEDVVHEMSDAQITDIATEVLKNFRTMKMIGEKNSLTQYSLLIRLNWTSSTT